MNVIEEFRKLVVSHGFLVAMGSEFCKKYKSEHNDKCFGCESEDGCNRYCSLAIVNMDSILYKPTSYSDHEAMQKSIQNKMQKILDVKTTRDEIKSLV